MQTDRLPALISQAGTVDSSARSRAEPYCRIAGLFRGAGRRRWAATALDNDRCDAEHQTEDNASRTGPHQPRLDCSRRSDVDQEPETDEAAERDEDEPRHHHDVRRINRSTGVVALPVAELVGVVLGLEAITVFVLNWGHRIS